MTIDNYQLAIEYAAASNLQLVIVNSLLSR
jgi:hypothetical protein